MSVIEWLKHPVTYGRHEAAEQEEIVIPSHPEPIVLTPHAVPSSYETLADTLGFSPGALLYRQVREFLIEQQIPLYNYNAVDAYMIAVATAAKANYFWRPLRQKDAENFRNYGWNRGGAHGYYQKDDSVCSPYDKLVPAHILQDVLTIQEKFGDRVAFFVSDYAADSPDPFILVVAPHKTFYQMIFGAWDEPGFGVL